MATPKAYREVMGPELGRLCYDLRNDLEWLKHKWSEYQELFGKGPERLALLNEVAPNFFYIIKQLMFTDAMHHLCRLTDPAGTGAKQNLTIMRLPKSIPAQNLKTSVETATKEVKTKCDFARLWRDKWLAHTDLKIHKDGWESALPGVTATHIEDAIESVSALIHLVEAHYGLPLIGQISESWGAKALVYHLKSAKLEQ